MGGIRTAIEAQHEGVAETVVPLSSVRSFLPARAEHLPRGVPYEHAPNYIREVCGPEAYDQLGWIAFLGTGFARLIASDADLLSALRFIASAPVDREWAVERNGAGGYRVIAGDDNSVDAVGEVLIHTHRNRNALPSEQDLQMLEDMSLEFGHRWSAIYSRRSKGRQLAFIARTEPYRFDVSLWTERRYSDRGVCRIWTRRFELETVFDDGPGIPKALERMEVVERSLSGAALSRSVYDYVRYPHHNIQIYWQAVLERTVSSQDLR